MPTKSTSKLSVVVPNWNGKDSLRACLDSLLAQTLQARIIVVENGSTDGSLDFLRDNYPQVEVVIHQENKGFAGGVNAGIRLAIDRGDDYVALFNNDAVADKNWLSKLVEALRLDDSVGIAACKLMDTDQEHFDSTGDIYTSWGLPYPRGRGELVSDKYDHQTEIFGASGGASLYRVSMLKQIGIFDEDFFAYYEDVDLSFRAQLAGWKVRYVPESLVQHQIGATSNKIKGFTTYQATKNLPLLFFKNVPGRYFFRIGWRFSIAYVLFLGRAASRGQGWVAIKGCARSLYLIYRKIGQRRHIQKSKTVSDDYIWSILTHDLPPNAHALRRLRGFCWKLTGKGSA